MVEKQMLPENTQLAVDYESVSSVNPPVKKAARFHTVSNDTLTRIQIVFSPELSYTTYHVPKHDGALITIRK